MSSAESSDLVDQDHHFGCEQESSTGTERSQARSAHCPSRIVPIVRNGQGTGHDQNYSPPNDHSEDSKRMQNDHNKNAAAAMENEIQQMETEGAAVSRQETVSEQSCSGARWLLVL